MLTARTGRILRVAGYVTAVFAATSYLIVKRAAAGLTETSMVMGKDLLPLKDLLKDGQPIKLNGETINFSATGTDQSPNVVVKRFSDYCKGNPGAIDAWVSMVGAKKNAVPTGLPYIVQRNSDAAVVVCLAKTDASPEGIIPALKKFSETGDLGALGMMRYAYIEGEAHGGSLILAGWTNETFNLSAILPRNDGADSPGTDPSVTPRPPQAFRVLSAPLVGTPYGAYIYQSKAPESEILSFYDEDMIKRGYTRGPTSKPCEKEPCVVEDKEAAGHRIFHKKEVVSGITLRKNRAGTFDVTIMEATQ